MEYKKKERFVSEEYTLTIVEIAEKFGILNPSHLWMSGNSIVIATFEKDEA